MESPITLSELQAFIKDRDHKPHKKKQYFLKFIEEVGELSEMIKKGKRLIPGDERKKAIKGTLEEEMADVLYYLVAIANIYEIDLEEAFTRKMAYNDKNKPAPKID